MTRAQPQYLIQANRNCATHPPGTVLVMVGPRNGAAHGWTVVGRYKSSAREIHGDQITGLI